MKKEKKEFSFLSLLWTLLLHGGVVLLLILLHLNIPAVQAESGLPVELGDMGNLDTDYDFTEITELPAPAPLTVPQPTFPDADVNITQDYEETVAIDDVEEESVADQERRVQEEAQNLMANVFGNSRNMLSSGEEPKPDDVPGTPGSVQGNSSQGATMGTGSYGTWDLGGRNMMGELPRPLYEGIQDEGRVVVTITVDPEGNVIKTQINNRTNTTNLQLRKSAEEAALKTRFNAVDGVNNQTGTITYYFKLK